LSGLSRRKRLLVQGATGSIGQSVLDVARRHGDRFQVVGVAARSNLTGLVAAAREFTVQSLAFETGSDSEGARREIEGSGIPHVFSGLNALEEQAANTDYDLLVNAVSGGAGLEPTAAALRRGISVALANKETLVAAGPIVMKMAIDHGAEVLPIDSEHSAIYQCLLGEKLDSIRKIWLTTSGGPFRDFETAELEGVSVERALMHPTWKMGQKITIDSATLFNKGLEVIEANRLFGIPAERIEVVIHRQSVVHSMVEFVDGSIKAQLSVPDMRLPILFALSYPERLKSDLIQTGIEHIRSLTFDPVPSGKFPCLDIAFQALERGGTVPAALSAADEVAVDAFLNHRIRFGNIAKVLQSVLDAWPDEPLDDIITVRRADVAARRLATEAITSLN